MEASGRILVVMEAREGVSQAGRAWRRQDFVLELAPTSQWEADHPKRLAMTASDGVDGRLGRMGLQPGRMVTVDYDIDAREWQGKWYNTLNAFAVRDFTPQTGSPWAPAAYPTGGAAQGAAYGGAAPHPGTAQQGANANAAPLTARNATDGQTHGTAPGNAPQAAQTAPGGANAGGGELPF